MKKIHVYGTKTKISTGGYDPEDTWSRNSTSTTWSIDGCGEVVPNRFESFDDIETGLRGTLYAVYVIYSSGDSFGHDERAYFELIWVYDNAASAQAAIQTIKAHAEWYQQSNHWRSSKRVNNSQFADAYSVDIDIGQDRPLTVSAGWNGYFENLDELDLVVFQLN